VFDLPGIQSNFIPNPDIYQEWTTSKLFVITLILKWAGNTSNLLVLKSLLFIDKFKIPEKFLKFLKKDLVVLILVFW
jgi:hypothetical protein